LKATPSALRRASTPPRSPLVPHFPVLIRNEYNHPHRKTTLIRSRGITIHSFFFYWHLYYLHFVSSTIPPAFFFLFQIQSLHCPTAQYRAVQKSIFKQTNEVKADNWSSGPPRDHPCPLLTRTALAVYHVTFSNKSLTSWLITLLTN